MKKVILLAIIATIINVTFISCEKEDLSQTTNQFDNSSGQLKEGINPEDIGCKPYTTYWCEECQEYCNNSGDNCAPCVIIIPPAPSGGGGIKGESNLETLSNMLNGETGSIANFFGDKSNYQDLFPALSGTDFLVKLQSGNYYLSRIFAPNNSNNKVFVFTNTLDNSIIALPYVEN